MRIIQGFPFRTDGGVNTQLEGGQCIIGADGSTCLGELVADEEFTSKVITALNQHEKLEVPRFILLSILEMAESNYQDVSTGLDDGTYTAIEIPNFIVHGQALDYFKGLLNSHVKIAAIAA